MREREKKKSVNAYFRDQVKVITDRKRIWSKRLILRLKGSLKPRIHTKHIARRFVTDCFISEGNKQ